MNRDYSFYKRLRALLKRPSVKTRAFADRPSSRLESRLFGAFAKVASNQYMQSLAGSTERLARTRDYELMDVACLRGDTKIVTPQGFITIEDLANKYPNGEEFIVYSYDHKKKQIVPARAHHARQTKIDHVWKVIFNDNSFIISTKDHPIMMRDGSYKCVEDLKKDDSCMPFYRKQFYKNNPYQFIYTCNSEIGKNGWITEHQTIANWYYKEVKEDECVHHADFDLTNNSPENLQIMKKSDHKRMHTKIINKVRWVDPEYRTKISKIHKERWIKRKVTLLNHKVKSIEYFGISPVYDLTVDGYQNFATDTVFVHNSSIISTACNIWADDATTYNEDGRVLKVTSTNQKIRAELNDLFFDRLNVDFNLWHWIRNMNKYGDFFLLIDVLENEGITSFLPLPTVEIEREEAYDGDIDSVRFKWNTASAVSFENWQVMHFRIIGDDTFLPYGKSLLESGRRIWKQLNLIEDAMLVYRIQRAPERRIFKIDVGNMQPNDIPGFMQKAKDILKRQPLVDEQGRVDLRYNVHPVHKDTQIPLLDGRIITIENLAKEHDSGKQNWVYSINDKTHQIVPGKVKWCGKNYTATKLVKVTLDDEGVVKTAGEHPFILRDGTSIRADQLESGMSLMPFYRSLDYVDWAKKSLLYETIYNPSIDKYEFTHRLVDQCINQNKLFGDDTVIHHQNVNRFDNTPENLIQMNKIDHWKWHSQYGGKVLKRLWKDEIYRSKMIERGRQNRIKWNKSDCHRAITVATNKKYDLGRKMGLSYNGTDLHKSHNVIRSEAMSKMWSDMTKRMKAKANMKNKWTDEMINILIETAKTVEKNQFGYIKISKLSNLLKSNNEFIEKWNNINQRKYKGGFPIDKIPSEFLGTLENKPKAWNYGLTLEDERVKNYSQKRQLNHKISKVEIIDEVVDVYCMEVVGKNDENDRHNFATTSVFVKNSQEEDYFIAVRGKESGTDISTLAGATNLGDIDDVRYVQSSLIAALGIPRAYLTYEENLSCLTLDTLVKLTDGRNLNMQSIIDEHESGKQNYVYTILNGTIKCGKILNAKYTKYDKIAKINLDNGKTIKCSYDHKFMLQNGNYIEAQYLKENDSLMSYAKFSVQKPIIKVAKVELTEEFAQMADIEIDIAPNFALADGIFVHNSKSTLSQEDMRFARTIQRIQKLAISELNKMAQIHLYAKGYDINELSDFKIHLTNPSNITEQLKLEVQNTKLTTYISAIQSVGVDRKWAQRHILRLTDEEIKKINLGIKGDTKFNAELQVIAQQIAQTAQQPGDQSGAPGGEPPLSAGQQPVAQIPGGEAMPPIPNAGQTGAFKNSTDNPMASSNPKKSDVKEDEDPEDSINSVSDVLNPNDKSDKEIIKITKKYDFLQKNLRERNLISKDIQSIFIKLDKSFKKEKAV